MGFERSYVMSAGQMRPQRASSRHWKGSIRTGAKARRACAAAVEALESRRLLSGSIDITVNGETGGGGEPEPGVPILSSYEYGPGESHNYEAYAVANDAVGNTYIGGRDLFFDGDPSTPDSRALILKQDPAGNVSVLAELLPDSSAAVTSIIHDPLNRLH